MTSSRSAPRPARRLGDRSVLVDCADLADAMGLRAALEASPLPGQSVLVPAAATLLVRFDQPLSPVRSREAVEVLGRLAGAAPEADGARCAEIPVRYDGEDLTTCAELLDASPEAVVRQHTEAPWRAAFAGFAPGFAYLVREDGSDGLRVPRRDSPRTRVPAGAVGLAGEFSAVYPQDSPGGWQLIGRTRERMWDADRERPALLEPGTLVRFRAVRETVVPSGPRPVGQEPRGPVAVPGADQEDMELHVSPPARDDGPPPVRAKGSPETEDPAELRSTGCLLVLSPGLSCLLQDAGRPGWEHLGVGHSGWADPVAALEANRLVGNPPGAVLLEHTAGGLRLHVPEAHGTGVVLAATGARAELRIIGPAPGGPGTRSPASHESGAPRLRRAPLDRPFLLAPGETLEAGPVFRGLRLCLAVRGSVLTTPVLGSASTDTLSGLGPAPLVAGDQLRVGPGPGSAVVPTGVPVDLPPAAPPPGTPGEVLDLPMEPGPRAEWFLPASLAGLARTVWQVSEDSNRVAARLVPRSPPPTGPASPAEPILCRTPEKASVELPSEPLVTGSVQVPPSGRPVVFLTDRPVTGGYPVVGVLDARAVRLVAQSPPGTLVRLVPRDSPSSSSSSSPSGDPCAPS